jgi:MOSC domain-containing protein YiiM
MHGRIFQLNSSPGGVPKLPVREAIVTELGLVDDAHNFPDIHGGPERALCLYSLERILELQAEGHPIFPGAIGENVTISGLDWERVQPGDRLQLGDEVLIEITKFTTPCNSMEPSFFDGNYARLSQKANPGYSRVYARVLQTGRLVVGQTVSVLDAGAIPLRV